MKRDRYFAAISRAIIVVVSSFVLTQAAWAQETNSNYSITQTPTPPRLTDFFQGGYYRGAAVSLDGQSLAMVKWVGSQSSVEILDLSEAQFRRGEGVDLPFFVEDVTWKNADTLVLQGTDTKGHEKVWLWRRGEPRVTNLFALSPTDDDYATQPTYSTYAQQVAAHVADQDKSAEVDIFPGVSLQSVLLGDSQHVLLNVRRDGLNRLVRVDISNLNTTVVDESDPRTWASWIISQQSGLPEVRRQWSRDSAVNTLIRPKTTSAPQAIIRQIVLENHFDFDIIGPSTKSGFVAVRGRQQGEDLASLYEYNLGASKFGERLIASSPGRDVLNADFNADGSVLAVSEQRDVLRPRARLLADQARIDKIAARLGMGDSFSILSTQNSAGLWVIKVFSPTNVGTLWVDDAKNDRFLRIGDTHRALTASSIGTSAWLNYLARDGRALSALVSRPANTSPQSVLPTVILPHGGPHGVLTTSEFDLLPAFLTSRGYQVVQPNFRGSGGMGAAFMAAGKRQWGGAMQDDISDLVGNLIQSGNAQSAKVAIVGGSYGGYAALAGATLTPELFSCAVSWNGVADLSLQMAFVDRTYLPDVGKFWRTSKGDPILDAAMFSARSPARLASRVSAPILLLVGQQDTIVDPQNSQAMYDALVGAGKRVRKVNLPRMAHSPHRAEDTMLVFGEIDYFLDTCIGAKQYDAKPPADRARPGEGVSVQVSPNW
jgi:dipeptidyl aminopeptidase/acylaminoacyl peptidase